MITSTSNRQIKHVIQLQKKAKTRREEGCFVVEGIRMASEAPKDRLLQVFFSESFYKKQEIPDHLKTVPTEVVEDRVFGQMSDTKTPQGILCIVRQKSYTHEDLLRKKDPLLLILEDLQDPGNVGTIFRTAEGAGVDGIIMSKNCVDIYHPKTIRSTMGSLYRMPFIYTEEMEDMLRTLRDFGVRSYAAHLRGENTYDREKYQGGTAFLIGNEGNGLSESLTDLADHLIRIPMEGELESLNAAVAAAILSYEAYRQRRNH